MNPRTLILALAALVIAQSVFLLWTTANFNSQLNASTEAHNAQLWAQTEAHNAQMSQLTERFNAQLWAQAAEVQKGQ